MDQKGGPGRRLVLILGSAVFALVTAGVCNNAWAKSDRGRVIVDMAARSVAVPGNPRRVVTLGSAPVINSFVFAMGKGGTIINGLPAAKQFNRSDCCRFQTIFAPQLDTQPSLEGGDWSLKSETLLLLRPDVVFTGAIKHTGLLEKLGISTVYIALNGRGETNKEIMALLGRVYSKEHESNRYIEYFDSVMHRVRDRIRDIPEKEKVRALYCNFKVMTQTSITTDWWIEAAGGISLGKDGPLKDGIRSFSAEHVLAWNPDIWIVSVPDEIDMVYRDFRFKNVTAVKNKKVFSVPVGSIRWSHPTSEQPLGVLWAAKLFYPERFKDLNIEAEMKYFYLTFFRYRLSGKEIKEMLTGRKQ
ncbi:MAG: iron-dicitrate transporter substrate-binding subunit [Syntrophorhabdus sp. PtaU1.Bin002]|nr:MAG: iron-dicitrate transporter substrate-binding subunit [Syntrophorhabdus sp. PtaU1.Bin002]